MSYVSTLPPLFGYPLFMKTRRNPVAVIFLCEGCGAEHRVGWGYFQSKGFADHRRLCFACARRPEFNPSMGNDTIRDIMDFRRRQHAALKNKPGGKYGR